MSKQSEKATWLFHPSRPGQSTVDGNISKLFNTGDSMPPKDFDDLVGDDDEAAVAAVIYGREGIANCVDASPAARARMGVLGLDFCFEKFEGEDSRKYWDLLGLETLASRSTSPGIDREKQLGLSQTDCLNAKLTSPLRILTVIESGGGGMPGGLDDPDSVLLRALMNIGEAQTWTGAAGSYGFGKAAVAQASRPRILFVYTCSPVGESTDGVTRRLLGLTYWGTHRLDGVKYSGWGLFGGISGDQVTALEDDEADAYAASLDIPVRNPEVQKDRGTTFMIVDPSFGAKHLKGAVETFWWPLLQNTRDFRLDLNIWDEDGEQVPIDVGRSHRILGPFVDRFLDAEVNRSTEANTVEATRVVQIGDAGITSLGVKDPESSVSGSLIAQMRSPLMVVSYERIRNANPDVVGVFVSHEATNENLRRVEPAEHDKWHNKKVAGLQATADDIKISKAVRDERKAAVDKLRAPEPEPVYGLRAFTQYFPAIDAKAAGPTKPVRVKAQPKKQRLVRVHLVHAVNDKEEAVRPRRLVESDGSLRAQAVAKFFLDPDRAKRVNRQFLDATVTVGARFEEDGTAGEWHPSNVDQIIVGFEERFEKISAPGEFPARFSGRFKVGENIFFAIETLPYLPDWTIDLFFDCSPWDVVAPVAATEGDD